MSPDSIASSLEEPDFPPSEGSGFEDPLANEPWEIQEYRAAVGLNADYYLRCWGLIGDAHPARVVFNFGALLSGLWLPFRKMYRATLIFYLLIGSWVFFELLVVVRTWNMELPGWLFSLTRLTPPVICGIFANCWYLRHIQRLVNAARAEQPDREARIALLEQRGGASVQSACSMVLLFSIMVVLALMVIELLAPVPHGP